MEQTVEQNLIKAAGFVEQQLDAELEKLDNLDIGDLQQLRQNRLKELKKLHQQQQDWLRLGHGEYTELSIEKEFFEVSKNSENIVCLFYKTSSPKSEIFDHHLKILAKKHIEAKFCKINAEKCPFLLDRLKIGQFPTIVLVVENKTNGYIVGFRDLGNREDFPTEVLEYRLSLSGVIKYTGECPKAAKGISIPQMYKSKTIRGKSSDDSDDDY